MIAKGCNALDLEYVYVPMGLHIYHSKRQLLRLSWGRVVTMDTVRRHFELLIANKSYPRNLRIITSTDVEEIGFPLTNENMAKIGEWRVRALEGYDSIYTALYNLKPVPSAYISFFSEFFDSPKSCLKQFSSEEIALKWLLGGVEPDGLLKV